MSERDDIIREAIRHGRTNASGWIRVDCPFCGDTRGSFGFNTQTGGFACNRSTCGVRGRIGGYHHEGAAVERKEAGPIQTGDFIPLWTRDAKSSVGLRDAIDYTARRGLNEEHVYFGRIHYAFRGKYTGRIVIPHVDAAGSWWGFTARKIYDGDDSPKVLYPPGMPRRIYNEQALLIDTSAPALVVEGCLDALKYLPDVVACLGKPTDEHHATFAASKRPLVFALDGDAWEEGRAWAMRLRYFFHVRAASIRLPGGKDPLDMDADFLRRAAAAALDNVRIDA